MQPYNRITDELKGYIELVMPFVVTIGAGAQGGQAIALPYLPCIVLGGTIYFPDNAIDNILVYFLESPDGSISTTGISGGEDLLTPETGTPYFIGHADAIHVTTHIPVESPIAYFKMHVVNNNAYAITIMGILTVRFG